MVRYFHDCLAAQCEWARSVNVIEQKDVTLLALTAHAQERLGTDGRLELRGVKAAELAKRAASGGAEVALSLGALFLVGQMPRPDEGAARRYCVPLLEVPMRLKQLAGGRIVVEPEEIEFSVNYSLVSELLGGDSDDLDDRLADLSELVPDFPIDATEFDTFWNGFRTIAPEVPLSPGLPPRQNPPRLLPEPCPRAGGLAKHGVPLEVEERFRYRRSLFDIAADAVDQRSLFFLSEHFRSHPQIIGFSNRQFDDHALCLMTSRPARDPAPAAIRLVRMERKVDG